jgi:hypothetical protein
VLAEIDPRADLRQALAERHAAFRAAIPAVRALGLGGSA